LLVVKSMGFREVAFVDDLEEDVGGVVPEGEVADLVDDQDVGVEVVVERLGQPSGAGGVGEFLDELERRW
jgi:hypothetical protein